MKIVEIWIPLLEEGSPAIRGTTAFDMGDGRFEIIASDDYNPDDEVWQFPPGSIVHCKKHINFGEEILLAFKKAE